MKLFIYLFIYSFIHLFIYLFIYSFIHFWLVFKKHCNQFGFHKKVSLQDFMPIFPAIFWNFQ